MSQYTAPPIPRELIPKGVPCVEFITEDSGKFFEIQQRAFQSPVPYSRLDLPLTDNKVRLNHELMEPFKSALWCMLQENSPEQTVGDCKLVQGYRSIRAETATDTCIMHFLDWICVMYELSDIIDCRKIYEQEYLCLDEQPLDLTVHKETVTKI